MRRPALAALLAAPLVAAAAAGPRCRDGSVPRLSGDPFAPVDCSTAPAAAVRLPGDPAPLAADAKDFVRSLEGRWEGSLIRGFGRYEVLLTIDARWGGRATLTLETKELQFRHRQNASLELAPAAAGRYAASLGAEELPGSLDGTATLGAPAPDGSRLVELDFVNGAAHRLAVRPLGDRLEVRAITGIPGLGVSSYRTELSRTKRRTL